MWYPAENKLGKEASEAAWLSHSTLHKSARVHEKMLQSVVRGSGSKQIPHT